jgi:ABC-type Fe3+/spermidine/putrescine transport system ATPase subunit
VTMAFIEVEELTKRYGASTVVDRVSFGAQEGELLTFLGPSGCGKTTTLRCIGGFNAPDAGTIRIGGADMRAVPPHRRQIGMVFQNYALFPHLSVFENVAFGLRVRGVAREEIARRTDRALDMVRLTGLATRYPKQLSGGQQQRVALARALVYQPRVLLLDEPLSNLDAKLRIEMRAEIRNLQRELGLTALYVTHDQEEALSISDRVMVMNQGRIEQISTPWDLYNRPRTLFVASFVGTANVLRARPNGAAVRVAETFDLTLPSGPATGPGSIVVRPEGVHLHDSTATEGFAATVRAVTLLGATLRIEIELAGGAGLVADVPHNGTESALRPGDAVRVTLDTARIVFIPESGDQACQPV